MEMAFRKSPWLIFFLLLFFCFLPSSSYKVRKYQYSNIGVNYGKLGSNLPAPETAASLVSSLSFPNVKIFDMDRRVIKAFANTGVSLSICIPNENISFLATHPYYADIIVRKYILPFYARTKISSISVGNEVTMIPEFAPILLPAMENMYRSLVKYRLEKKIHVSTCHSLAVLAIRFPPSEAVFQESIAEPVLRPVLEFLDRTNSSYMVNLYPYLTYKETPYIPLDFALFSNDARTFNVTDPNTQLVYDNLFDLLVDSLNSAAFSLGFYNLPLVVTETGWPSKGNPDDPAASLENAAVFNKRLVRHVAELPLRGTPLRPGLPISTYIFSLFDEDLKSGAPTEKHWGLMYSNGTKKYELGISNSPKSSVKDFL